MSNLTADKIKAAIEVLEGAMACRLQTFKILRESGLSPEPREGMVATEQEMQAVIATDTALAALRECAERRDGCEFCKNFDFSGASAKKDSGKYPHIHLAGGSYRYPRDEQFDCCPKCGRKRERSDT